MIGNETKRENGIIKQEGSLRGFELGPGNLTILMAVTCSLLRMKAKMKKKMLLGNL